MRFGETTFARFISSAAGRMPRIVVKARLPAADVLKSYQSRVGGVSRRSRADAEALPDDTETDEHGAVYVWESRKAFEAFGASELAR